MSLLQNLLNTKNSPIDALMKADWFLGFLMVVVYLDGYFQIRYGIPVYTAIKESDTYLTEPIDYFIVIFFFSLTFTTFFIFIKFIHIFFISGILDRVGCKTYNGVSKDYKSAFLVKLKAARENNSVLMSYCNNELEKIKVRKRISRRFLGVVFFTLLHWIVVLDYEHYPIIFKALYLSYEYMKGEMSIIKFIIILLYISISFSILWLIDAAFKIEHDNIYYPDDDK